MATHKSSEKRARQSVRKSSKNTRLESAVKTQEKKVRSAIAAKDAKAAQVAMIEFTSQLGKATQKGAFKKETASRKVSRLSTQISALK